MRALSNPSSKVSSEEDLSSPFSPSDMASVLSGSMHALIADRFVYLLHTDLSTFVTLICLPRSGKTRVSWLGLFSQQRCGVSFGVLKLSRTTVRLDVDAES